MKKAGAGEGNRTPTDLRPSDFESDASTSSTTPARKKFSSRALRALQGQGESRGLLHGVEGCVENLQRVMDAIQGNRLIYLYISKWHEDCLSVVII